MLLNTCRTIIFEWESYAKLLQTTNIEQWSYGGSIYTHTRNILEDATPTLEIILVITFLS
jgi:hypothetical protein